MSNPYFAAVLQGAEQTARQHGYAVMLASVRDEHDWQQVVLDATVAIPTVLIGEQALLLLLSVLQKGHVPSSITVPLELVIRVSTSAVRSAS